MKRRVSTQTIVIIIHQRRTCNPEMKFYACLCLPPCAHKSCKMVFTHPHTYFISASFSFRTQTLQTDPFRHLSLILSGSIRAENFSTVCHVRRRQTVRLQTDHNSEAHCPRLRILLAQLIPDLVSHEENPFFELEQFASHIN